MKILVVEDDRTKLKQLTHHLEHTLPGVIIHSSGSRQGGIKEMLTFVPDILILDMAMPTFDTGEDESGFEPVPNAGRDIMAQMVRRRISNPVMIVTQFDKFGVGDKSITRSELDSELRSEFPDIYVGMVYYSVVHDTWRADLDVLLHEAVRRFQECQ